MGGLMMTLRAPTKGELAEKVEAWIREQREAGLSDIRRGWDPAKAVRTEDGGWEISVWVHS